MTLEASSGSGLEESFKDTSQYFFHVTIWRCCSDLEDASLCHVGIFNISCDCWVAGTACAIVTSTSTLCPDKVTSTSCTSVSCISISLFYCNFTIWNFLIILKSLFVLANLMLLEQGRFRVSLSGRSLNIYKEELASWLTISGLSRSVNEFKCESLTFLTSILFRFTFILAIIKWGHIINLT